MYRLEKIGQNGPPQFRFVSGIDDNFKIKHSKSIVSGSVLLNKINLLRVASKFDSIEEFLSEYSIYRVDPVGTKVSLNISIDEESG